MEWFKYIVILPVLALSWSCEDAGSGPGIPLPQGTATITDSSITFSPTSGYEYKTAFSFSKLLILRFNGNMFDSTYDILSYLYFDRPTNGWRVGLISAGDTLYRRPFRFIASYPDAAAAFAAFSMLVTVPDSSFVLVTGPIQAYQIWVVKTNTGSYAKILIQDVYLKLGTGSAPTDTVYSRVTFEWMLQPNGSKSFLP